MSFSIQTVKDPWGYKLEASQEPPALEILRNTTLERRRKGLLGDVVVGTVTQDT